MRIPARLLLILLLALGLYLPASLLTRAQQPGIVNVRPRVTSPQPGIPEVRATVDRNRVPVGQEVTFILSPARIVSDPRYRVTLFFGDGKRQVMRQAKITHSYPQTGTYTYSILVEAEKQPTPTPTPRDPVPAVKLSATPTTVEVNRPVNFSAQLSRRYPNIKYRFVFADGSDSGWQDSSNVTHAYRSPNTYKTYVDIGVYSNGSTKQVGGSQRELVKVEPRIVNASVKLTANPTSVEADKPVTFNARVNPESANARYRFEFGDKTPATNWQASSQTTHRYKTAGKYSAQVEVRRATTNASTISDSITIQVSRAPDEKSTVDLKVVPGSVLEGFPVFFEAVPSAANASARFRFDFGDGSATTAWSSSRYQTHSYKAAGRYSAFVEMSASGNEPSAASGKKSVRVTAININNNNNDNRNNNQNRNQNNNSGNANSNATPRANANTSPNRNANVPVNTNVNRNANVNTNTNSFGSVNGNVNVNGNANGNVNANSNLNQNANVNVNGNVNGNRNGNTNGSGNLNASTANSNSTPVVPPEQTESNDWWKYIIILVILLLAGYQVYSHFFAPRPTFVPHVDMGDANVGADNPLAINMQMDVDPNIAAGEFNIDTEGDSLIKSKRIE